MKQKSHNLSCVWLRSGQLVRFWNFLNILPIMFKVIFVSMVVKGKYPMCMFLAPFGIQIANHSGTFWMFSDWESTCFCSLRNFSDKWDCGVTPHCDLKLPKMLPMCSFMPPVLTLCCLNSSLIIVFSLKEFWVYQ